MQISPTSAGDVRQALDSVAANLGSLIISINNLRSLLAPEESSTSADDVNPRDPQNKSEDGKLTDRGIEICYRLFDKGVNRNQVAGLMDISFTAATHRYHAWQKLGGPQREKGRLD